MVDIPPRFLAFTSYAQGGIVREIITEVGLMIPDSSRKNLQSDDPNILKTKGLWDTGATNCVVSKKIAAQLGLKPISETIVHYGSGKQRSNVYMVDLILPNSLRIPFVTMTECADSDSFGMIIGMDVICRGDFAITNVGGVTTVSFRVPSMQTIDYVKEYNELRESSIKVAATPQPVTRAEKRRLEREKKK